jgi:hypothetical protein
VDLQETGCEGVEWIQLPHMRTKFWAVFNVVVNIEVPLDVGDFWPAKRLQVSKKKNLVHTGSNRGKFSRIFQTIPLSSCFRHLCIPYYEHDICESWDDQEQDKFRIINLLKILWTHYGWHGRESTIGGSTLVPVILTGCLQRNSTNTCSVKLLNSVCLCYENCTVAVFSAPKRLFSIVKQRHINIMSAQY